MALSKLTDIRKSLSVEVEDLQVNGIGTFSGNVSIGGTLTYEDVTNIDSVGIITAQSGINCGGDLDITGQYLKIENAASPEIQLTDTNANNSLCFIRNSSGNLRLAADNNNVQADTSIRFLVDGGEKARIASDGKVGVNVTSPAALMHVSGSYAAPTGGFGGSVYSVISNSGAANNSCGLSINAGNNGVSFVQFGDTDDANVGTIEYLHSDNSMVFDTNASERLRIDNGGRIGLGITNPSAYFSSYNRVVMGRTTDTGGMTIVSAPTSGGYIAFADGTSGNEAYRGQIAYYHSQDSMVFGTDGGTERLRINNKGHLGLNVTPGSWDNTFKALEGGGSSKHGELFFQANGDWTTALGCNLYFNSGWKYRHTGAANWLEMKEDRTTFYMADSGSADSAISWLERLRIHSTGYITKPYQVAFFAHCTFGNHDLSAGDKFQFNVLTSSGKAAVDSTHHTFGGTAVFNTSTNTFTAPVAGLYSFTVAAYFRRTGDPITHLLPRVNNTEVSNGNNNMFFFGSNDITDGSQLCGTVYLQLAANDAVTVHRRGTQTGTTRFYGPHSHFCGHLIG